MPWMAVAGALGGLGSIIGSGKQANAASDISGAQLVQARQTQSMAMGAAGTTADDLANISRQNQVAMQATSFQQSQLDSTMRQLGAINPAITEAFNQQVSILRGQTSPLLAPLQKQQAIDARGNQSRIGALMGNGAAASSAGATSNAIFSNQQGQQLMNAQLSALSTLGQVGAQGVQAQQGVTGNYVNGVTGATNANNAAFGMNDAVSKRMLSAITGTNITPYAGGGSAVGQLYQGQGLSSLSNTVAGIGGSGLLYNAFAPKVPYDGMGESFENGSQGYSIGNMAAGQWGFGG